MTNPSRSFNGKIFEFCVFSNFCLLSVFAIGILNVLSIFAYFRYNPDSLWARPKIWANMCPKFCSMSRALWTRGFSVKQKRSKICISLTILTKNKTIEKKSPCCPLQPFEKHRSSCRDPIARERRLDPPELLRLRSSVDEAKKLSNKSRRIKGAFCM